MIKYILALLALMCLICPALADSATSNVTPIRISQGDPVYLGETVDISAVAGWASYFAYTDGYSEPTDDATIVTIKTPDTKQGYYNYYIDPSIFENRLGRWYTWYGKFEPAGNMLAFNVIAGTRPVINATNTTNVTPNVTEIIPMQPTPLLPEVRVADYLLARGDSLFVDTPGGGKVWIFGTNSGLYDIESKSDNITISSEQLQGLEPGTYTLLLQTAGKNGQFDVRYANDSIQWSDKWNGIKSVSISGLQPILASGIVQDTLGKTDDNYIVLRLIVELTQVRVDKIDERGLTDEEFLTVKESGLVTWYDVRGYSNLANNTPLKVYLDKEDHVKDRKAYTFDSVTSRTSVGNRSVFQCIIPMVWDKIAVGMHTITIVAPDGAFSNYDFYVSEMPADSYRPNATLKYVEGRNPYVPPVYINTTVTVEVTKEVIKEVIKEVPPPQESVDAAQKKAVAEVVGFYASIFIVLALISGIGYYMTSVYRRAKRL
jgi:hypothetical protein